MDGFNTKEFSYLKPKNFYLQTFNAARYRAKAKRTWPTYQKTTRTRDDGSLWNFLKPYFKEYCSTSSIHCFHYFVNDKLRFYEKVIWLVIVVATSVCCTIVYFDLAELYISQRVQTTVADSAQHVFTIPFPSVGICLRNRIDWTVLQNQAAKHFLPPDADNQTLEAFHKFFESLADVKFYTLHHLKPIFESSSSVNLSLIDDIDILEVMEYLTFPCEQVLSTVCMWRYKPYNCCDLFTLERTEMGFCYIFNSAVSPKMRERAKTDAFYPYHNSYSGEGSGLEFDVFLDEAKMKPGVRIVNGLYIMIKKAEEWHDDVKFINHNTFTKLALIAQITEVDKRVRHVSPVKRNCLYEDESDSDLYKKIPDLSYSRSNCRTRCHQEYVLKYCNCNLDILFPNHESDNFKSCKPSDFHCIFKYAGSFNKETHVFESKYIHDVDNESMTCNCLNNCNQQLYSTFYTSFPLESANTTIFMKSVHLDVHFQRSYMLKYRTTMRYTVVELLANFGGIIGLFLGASLLSAVELIYYLTFGLYIRLRSQLTKRHRHNTSGTQTKPRMIKIAIIQPKEIFKN